MGTITVNSEHITPVAPNDADALPADKLGERLMTILNEKPAGLVQLLSEGETQDVMSYKYTLRNKRLQALDELTAYDQELGIQ